MTTLLPTVEPLFRTRTRSAILTPFDLVELGQRGTVHFLGIGGAGMAPLAELLLRAGARVSGCDAQEGGAAAELARKGVAIARGHDPAHLAGCSALVVTAAVSTAHPEVEAARRDGIPVLKRAEALGSVVNRGTVIGIAGTHGKTTTTALTTAVLAAIGLDPTGLVGGRVAAWNGHLRAGGNRHFVVEADEYDRSFLTLHPQVAVVTTLEADHLDTYGSLRAVEDAFREFADAVPAGGRIVAGGDDGGVGRVLPRLRGAPQRVLTYGERAGAMLRIENVRLAGRESSFELRLRGKRWGSARLRVPGRHNVHNAAAAAAVAHHFGGEWRQIAEGLGEYTGVDRRFELIGEAGGVMVVDDYAHHPTELVATLRAARAAYPHRRLVAVFQPHLYSRTRDFAAEFGRALGLADRVFVADVYAAREAPIAGVTGELVVEVARRMGTLVDYVPERAAVAETVAAELREGDLCVTLGAGDLDRAAREILALIQPVTVG